MSTNAVRAGTVVASLAGLVGAGYLAHLGRAKAGVALAAISGVGLAFTQGPCTPPSPGRFMLQEEGSRGCRCSILPFFGCAREPRQEAVTQNSGGGRRLSAEDRLYAEDLLCVDGGESDF